MHKAVALSLNDLLVNQTQNCYKLEQKQISLTKINTEKKIEANLKTNTKIS